MLPMRTSLWSRLSACTRPGPRLNRTRKPGANRIPFNIADNAIRFVIAANAVIIALVLPERLSGSPQYEVSVGCCRTLDPSHDDRHRLNWPHDNVYVIRHNNPDKEIVQTEFIRALFQSICHKRGNAMVFESERSIRCRIQQIVGLCKLSPSVLWSRPLACTGPRNRPERTPRYEQNRSLRVAMRKISLMKGHKVAGQRPTPQDSAIDTDFSPGI
jgi:hypothetical protein